jgi:hypothetical protein
MRHAAAGDRDIDVTHDEQLASGNGRHARAGLGDEPGADGVRASTGAPATSLRLGHGADYTEFVEAQFIALALRENLMRLRG